jgi:hypothetical protein
MFFEGKGVSFCQVILFRQWLSIHALKSLCNEPYINKFPLTNCRLPMGVEGGVNVAPRTDVRYPAPTPSDMQAADENVE